jgi:hypothetical protein
MSKSAPFQGKNSDLNYTCAFLLDPIKVKCAKLNVNSPSDQIRTVSENCCNPPLMNPS